MYQKVNDYNEAVDVYQGQVKAYLQAAKIVKDCRRKGKEGQNIFLDFIDSLNAGKWFALGHLTIGAVDVAYKRINKFQKLALDFRKLEQSRLQRIPSPRFYNGPKRWYFSTTAARAAAKAAKYEEKNNTALSRFLNRPPDTVEHSVDSDLLEESLGRKPRLGGAAPIARGVPIAGWGLTGLSVYNDIDNGKDPTRAVVTNVGGTLLGGAAAGATAGAIGGPLGAGTGAVVGVGIGIVTTFSIDQAWDPVADKIGDTRDAFVNGMMGISRWGVR
ncbi:hypothetical protein ABGB12_20555 [Actinocorallia sp. B10E7]